MGHQGRKSVNRKELHVLSPGALHPLLRCWIKEEPAKEMKKEYNSQRVERTRGMQCPAVKGRKGLGRRGWRCPMLSMGLEEETWDLNNTVKILLPHSMGKRQGCG